MDFELVCFIGEVAFGLDELCDVSWRGVSLIRYADDWLASPSCSDWAIPGTMRDYQ